MYFFWHALGLIPRKINIDKTSLKALDLWTEELVLYSCTKYLSSPLWLHIWLRLKMSDSWSSATRLSSIRTETTSTLVHCWIPTVHGWCSINICLLKNWINLSWDQSKTRKSSNISAYYGLLFMFIFYLKNKKSIVTT